MSPKIKSLARADNPRSGAAINPIFNAYHVAACFLRATLGVSPQAAHKKQHNANARQRDKG